MFTFMERNTYKCSLIINNNDQTMRLTIFVVTRNEHLVIFQ